MINYIENVFKCKENSRIDIVDPYFFSEHNLDGVKVFLDRLTHAQREVHVYTRDEYQTFDKVVDNYFKMGRRLYVYTPNKYKLHDRYIGFRTNESKDSYHAVAIGKGMVTFAPPKPSHTRQLLSISRISSKYMIDVIDQLACSGCSRKWPST